eukprot:jgi/Botrbrau1/22263/Bobra.0138s0025.1
MTDLRAIEHRVHPLDWEDPSHPMARKEPRRGRRFVLAATIKTPYGPLQVYSAHLEVFCGILARLSQFADILKDAKSQMKKGIYHQAICGDLNTMGHRLPRLARNFCTDKMRFLTIGQEEASFWENNVLNVLDPASVTCCRKVKEMPGNASTSSLKQSGNQRLLKLGLDEAVCNDILNPGFKDPFDPVKTVTLDHPGFRFFGHGLVKGKLDWLLMRCLKPITTSVGNDDYSMSDHKWLCADVTFS